MTTEQHILVTVFVKTGKP